MRQAVHVIVRKTPIDSRAHDALNCHCHRIQIPPHHHSHTDAQQTLNNCAHVVGSFHIDVCCGIKIKSAGGWRIVA